MTRPDLDSDYRSAHPRLIATFDTRQQTAYGTLRTYLLLGYSHELDGARARRRRST